MDRLTIQGRRDNNLPHFAIFPIRDVNRMEIENQFDHTALYTFIQILNYFAAGTLWVLVNAALLLE
jgi:hypothetical protein